jgi:hypothetical protein
MLLVYVCFVSAYEAPIRDTIPIRYRYGDTRNFLKFPIRYGRDTLLKNKFKIKYTNTQYINITKIEKDNKLTFKLLKLCKQVTITYLKSIKYYPKSIIITIKKQNIIDTIQKTHGCQ